MSYGRLAATVLAANTDTVVYTAPVNCLGVELAINILNPNVLDATIKIALAVANSPTAEEYIENGAIVPANGGILERTQQMCSPGERVVIRSTLADSVIRVSGKVITEYN